MPAKTGRAGNQVAALLREEDSLSHSTSSSPRGRRRLRRRTLIALVGLGAALVVAVPLAWASHQFTDVPDSNPFHGDITAISGAGVTGGKTCVPPGAPPTYCPSEGITREAMAAFVHRGFGRVGSVQDGNFSLDGGAFVDIVVTTVSIGGVPGNTQFVKLDAALGAFTLSPPDDVLYRLVQDGVGAVTFNSGVTLGTAGPGGAGAIGSGSMSIAVAVPTSTTQTFRLQALDFGNTGGIQAFGHLTALTVPFGSTGGSTLGVSPSSGGGIPTGK